MKKSRVAPFRLQQDKYDCGVACLRNILNYYKADIAPEKLREWSGAGIQGTSLLGLHAAARQAGFVAQGAKADGLEQLLEVKHPCILHVTLEGTFQHYVVYYPEGQPKTSALLIGDPARGMVRMTAEELEKIWIGRTVLLLEPGEGLSRWQDQRKKKWRWLWDSMNEDVHLLYVALAIGAVCALLNLSTAIFSQQLVDRILPGRKMNTLYVGLAALALLMIIRSLFSFLRQDLMIRQGFGFNIRITGKFYRNILYLNKSFFDNRKIGDLTARLSDSLRIQQAVSYILGDMAIQALLMVVALAFLFLYNWPIAVGCLLAIPAVFGLVGHFQEDIVRGQRDVMLTHARNESNYVDSIRGIHTIKVMNKQSFFASTGAAFFQSFQNSIFRLGKTRIRFNAYLDIVTSLFLLGIICWASFEVLHGDLRIGGLLAIIQLAGLFIQAIVAVALTNLQVQEASVALDRMYEFTMLEPEFPLPEKELQLEPFRRLTVEKAGFRFPGRKLLLKEISLEINKGEIIALTGDSGQGKSTLLQILQRFYPYEGGVVRFNGQELSTVDIPAWRRMIGVVPQDIALFSGALAANIALDPVADWPRLAAFCTEYGFDQYFEQLPQSYATLLGEGGVALSGGQRQLLALARCLFARPQLVLLDEPTAAMDATTERFVIGVLQRYRKEAGMLIISHKDSLTEMADRVYVLQDGVSHPMPAAVYR